MSKPHLALDPMPPDPKQPQRSDEDQKELAELDRIWERIERCIPPAPYILSTPSMTDYKHYSRHDAEAWMMGHLWQRNEEPLQYRTYVFREPCTDIFILQPDDSIPAPDGAKAKPPLDPVPIATGAPKKKISLSDYKAKKANGIITPGSKKVSPDLVPTKPSLSQKNGVNMPSRGTQSTPAQKPDDSQSRKRKEADLPAAKTSSQSALPLQEGQLQVKRQRKTSVSEIPQTSDASAPSSGTPHGLPPLLSPVGSSFPNRYDLPPILSPTLPGPISAELDRLERLETERRRAESNASTSSLDRKSGLLPVPDAQRKRAESNASTSSSDKKARLPVSDSKIRVKQEISQGDSLVQHKIKYEKSPSTQPAQLTKDIEPANEEERSLVVKLKYSKQTARRMEQLLKLPAKKERQETTKERTFKAQPKVAEGGTSKSKATPKPVLRRADNVNSNTKGDESIAVRPLEKRPRGEDEPAMPSKRPKIHASRESPSTPSQQAISSPTLSNKSSTQKSQGIYTTPRKDLKALSMIRNGSAEGYDSTPGRPVNTPSSVSKHIEGKAGPTSAPINGKKLVDVQPLSQLSQRLNSLGRSLKHECQKIAEKGKRMTEEDAKRAAVTGLECVLSYMAAFYITDLTLNLRGRPGEVDNTWKTLLPLAMSYTTRTKDFGHLDGLRLHLGTVIASCICGPIAQRSRHKPRDSPHDQPHTDPVANLTMLSEHIVTLMRCASEARSALSVDDLMQQFPKTWANRETVTKSDKKLDKLVAGVVSGPYVLPISLDTSPIQAVRFGLKFLKEYCEKEGLKYETRVNMEKAN